MPLWIICAEPEYASRGCGLRGLGHKVEGCNEGLYSAQKCQPSLLEWFGVECFTSCVHAHCWTWLPFRGGERNMHGLFCPQNGVSKRSHAHQRMRILCLLPSLFYPDFQNLDEPCFTAFLCRTSRRNLQETVSGPIHAACGFKFAVSQKKSDIVTNQHARMLVT